MAVDGALHGLHPRVKLVRGGVSPLACERARHIDRRCRLQRQPAQTALHVIRGGSRRHKSLPQGFECRAQHLDRNGLGPPLVGQLPQEIPRYGDRIADSG